MSQEIPSLRDFLALAHWPATERLRDLMNKVKIADLSVAEVVALVAIFDVAFTKVIAAQSWAPEGLTKLAGHL